MSPRFTRPATLLRTVDGTERDPNTNRPVRTVQRVPITISAPQPRPSTETTTDGGAQRQTWDLFVWTDTEITGSDRVEIDGLVYELDGDPGVFRVGRCFDHQEALISRAR
jgi:hypothetical protein